MSEFVIDTNRVSDSISQLENVGQNLSDIGGRLGDIRRNIPITSIAMPVFRSRLRGTQRTVMDLAVQMDTLAEALGCIIDYYTGSERNVMANAGVTGGEGFYDRNETATDRRLREAMEALHALLVALGLVSEDTEPGVTQLQEQVHDNWIRDRIGVLRRQERFSEETWAGASVEERRNILNEYLREMSALMGVPIGAVHFDYIEGQTVDGTTYYTMGYYDPNRHQVAINEWVLEQPDLDSYDLMNTIAHEMRHAYQHAACENPDAFIVSEETIAQWQESFDNYRSTEDFVEDFGMTQAEAFQAYQDQAVEADARSFER